MTLRVEPAEPTEAEECSNAEWSPDWQPEHLWNAEPDVGGDAGRSLLGMMIYEARPAETWDEFEKSMRDLLVSFGADLPALLDYVPHVLCQVTPETGEHELSVWANASGIHADVITFNTTDSTETSTMPLEPGSGALAADFVMEVVRGWGLDSPARLRCRSYSPAPVRLSARSGFRVPDA
ncbi:hypothetical protein [Actinoplanes sp. CA-252034]|uniref:hypothetical protein n=1 Tax=Actinoplanes sp. CA-252034 TaxID=3239906 RepID=UPI003D97B514